MNLFEEQDIKTKMEELVEKWKGKTPELNSPAWWRYRADQSLYLTYKAKLNDKPIHSDQADKAEKIFNSKEV
jgi:hypothetical protein